MKRTIYLISISLVTIVCVAFSVTRDLGFDGFEWIGGANWGKHSVDYTVIEKFDRIAVEGTAMEIKIRRNTVNEYAVKYSYSNKYEPHYSVSKGSLNIIQSSRRRHLRNAKCEMTIMVPADARLEMVDVRLDIADIKISEISAKEYNLDAAMGDIKLENIDFDKAEINANLGDVSLEDCSFKNLRIDENLGDVDVKSSRNISDYSFDLQIDLGEISVNGKKYAKGFRYDGKDGSITINNNLGDISVEY